MFNPQQKLISSIVLVVMLFFVISGAVVTPQPAHASTFGVIAVNTAKWVWEKVGDIYTALKSRLSTTLITNSVDLFAQRMAVNMAKTLATGGRGQQPMFSTKVFNDVVKDAAGAAAGDFIGQLSSAWGDLGINLCEPSLDVKATITMSLLKSQKAPEPKCDLASVVRNWDSFIKTNTDPKALAEGLQVQFQTGKSDFSASFALNNKLLNQIKSDELVALFDTESQGYKSKTNTTNTEIQTPSSSVEDTAEAPAREASNAQLAKTFAAITSQDTIFGRALSTFGNTFLSQLLNRWILDGMNKLNNWKNSQVASTGGANSINFDNNSGPGPEAASAYYSNLISVSFNSVDDYTPTSDFTICPTTGIVPYNNCVMNQKFYSAFNRTQPMTVQQAIDAKLLSPDLPLISQDDPRNNDVNYCYNSALCYSNLQKMRLARLIPLGWEIAASISSANTPATMGEVLAAFDNPDSPYHNLIDPNWVLKEPRAQCLAMGPGPQLQSIGSDQRTEMCVDSQTCLRSDDNGECLPGAWGYCTREENIWRFGGQQCSPAYASCRNYKADGQTYSYIKDTLDFCTADEVGCQWYSVAQELGAAATETFSPPQVDFNNVPSTITYDQASADQFCLQRGYDFAQSYDQEGAGTGDIIWNSEQSSWELNTAAAPHAIISDISCVRQGYDWLADENIYLNAQAGDCDATDAGCTKLLPIQWGVNLLYNGGFEKVGSNNNRPDGWYWSDTDVSLTDNRSEVFAGERAVSTMNNYSYVYTDVPLIGGLPYYIAIAAKTNDSKAMGVTIKFYDSNDALIMPTNDDDIDIGDSSVVNWREGCGGGVCHFSGDLTITNQYVKYDLPFIAPEGAVKIIIGMGTGGAGSGDVYLDNVQLSLGNSAMSYRDYNSNSFNYLKIAPDYLDCSNSSSVECANYAPSCTAEEMGCQLYTPVNGDPAVAGVVNSGDYCSQSCAGLDQYWQKQTTIENMFGDDPAGAFVNFIPSSAQQCQVQDVGCEEFTNLDRNEALEYYSDLRMCVSEADVDIATYYTWEGSDTAGYQLKTWRLLKSNDNDGPCTNIAFDGENNICVDSEVSAPACDTSAGDDCRTFIDAEQNSFVVNQAQVIKASADCTLVRRTANPQDIAVILPSESNSCTVAAVGCHAYQGNSAGNTRIISYDDFESGQAGWSGGGLTTESLTAGGHSLWSNGDINKSLFINDNHSFTLSFYAKRQEIGNSNLSAQLLVGDHVYDLGSVAINDEWQQYALGPIGVHEASSEILEATLQFSIGSTTGYFLDNINLKQINSDLYLLAGSWQTPDICLNGNNGPVLGCQEYKDVANNSHHLYQFSSLCGEDKVGCSAFINTQNSTSPLAQSWPMGADDEIITVSADKLVYLVDRPEFRCDAGVQGCSALGEPVMQTDPATGNQSVASWSDVYKLNNPDNYEGSLCREDALYCRAYQSDEGVVYITDPGDKTCAYLENYTYDGTTYEPGWYLSSSLSGEPQECGPGIELPKRRDDNYQGYAGLCIPEANGCTEFIDPVGTTGDDLIRNGNFEFNNNTLTTPDFWSYNKNLADNIRWDASEGWDDSYAASALYADNTSYVQNISGLSGGVDYVVRIKAKGIANGDRLRLGLECEGANISSRDNSFIISGNVGDRQFIINNTNGDFVDVSAKFRINNNIDNNSCDISLGFAGNDLDGRYFDNVSVRRLQSYYYINDDKLNGVSCSGQVSQDKGCVLVEDTSQLSLDDGQIITQYDSSSTYHNSTQNSGNLVLPVSCQDGSVGCDANRIISVSRDRQCSEWLACQSSTVITQPDGSQQQLCYDLGRCTQLSPDGTQCLQWVDRPVTEKLDVAKYQSREVGWSGQDYSGYSLLDIPPLETLVSSANNDTLTLHLPTGTEGMSFNSISPSCRLYPSTNAPFSTENMTVRRDDNGNIISKPQTFAQANLCDEGGAGCECSYREISYSQGETRYYGLDYQYPDAITHTDGSPDSTITKINEYRGAWGFCLQRDMSRTIQGVGGQEHPCITWLPLNILSGEYDPNAVDVQASLNLPIGNMYYCAAGSSDEVTLPSGDYSSLVQFGDMSQLDSGDLPQGGWTAYPSNVSNQQGSSCISYPAANQGTSWMELYAPSGSCYIENNNLGDVTLGPDNQYHYRLTFELGDIYGTISDQIPYFAVELSCNQTDYLATIPDGGNDDVLLDINSPVPCDSVVVGVVGSGEERLMQIRNLVVSTPDYITQQQTMCTDIVQVEYPKFNQLINPPVTLAAWPNQYKDWYGRMSVSADTVLNNYNTPINVESVGQFSGVDVINSAGTPYSNISGSEDIPYSQCVGVAAAAGATCAGGEREGQSCSSDMQCPVNHNDTCEGYIESQIDQSSCDYEAGQYTHCDTIPEVMGTCVNSGASCRVDNDCAPYNTYAICQSSNATYDCHTDEGKDNCYAAGGRCLGLDTATPLTVYNQINDVDNTGFANVFSVIKELFAKIVARFSWSNGSYQSNSSEVGGSISDAEVVTIRPVITLAGEETAGSSKGITINSKTSGDISFAKDSANVTMKFYAYNVSGDQIPLNNLVVDWGDGSIFGGSGSGNSIVPGDVSLKNHQSMCINNCSTGILDDAFGAPAFSATANNFNFYAYPNTQHDWHSGYAYMTQKTGYDASNNSTRNWMTLRLPANKMSAIPRFAAGDVLTLEYDYQISPGFLKNGIANHICYGIGYCSQGKQYPFLSFATLDSMDDFDSHVNTWGHYSSTAVVTPDMVSACVDNNNPSGYCLRELAVANLRDQALASPQTIRIKNVHLLWGCRNNNSCTASKFGNLGQCQAIDIGDDLRFCVDDYQNSIGYFSFNHTYTCADPNPPGDIDGSSNSCIYKPKVYIEDNWGYCTEGSSNVCKDNYSNSIQSTGWFEYPGSIRLTP
ncbi:MAG: hypothetical protein ACKKL5_03585 [Candidatus Komeilibacteria bacterium]